jgi:pimeloyl-ACP methyl ester carboxylesterase
VRPRLHSKITLLIDVIFSIVQAATDAAIAKEIARQLRAGTIASRKFTNIIAVGHSYGSIQTNAITRTDPSLVDHIILTGYTASTAGVPLYLSSAAYTPAHLVSPRNFAGLPRGYLMTALPQTSQINFWYWPEYTPEAAQLTRAKEQPVSHGVLLTFGTLPGPAPDFKGTVAVVTGDKDFIFCSVRLTNRDFCWHVLNCFPRQGNCNAVPPESGFTTLLDTVEPLYPAVANFTAYSIPDVGSVLCPIPLFLIVTDGVRGRHGLSSHKATPATYQWIQEYIASL